MKIIGKIVPETINFIERNITKKPDKVIENSLYVKSFMEFIKGKDKTADKVFSTYVFSAYGRNGIPLVYPRNQFTLDIESALKNCTEKEVILNKFNLNTGCYDIDGIPIIPEKISSDIAETQMANLIEKFYTKNDVVVGNTIAKNVLNNLIKGFPEFAMTIGKVQHWTHIYSVDIHSLLVLQKSMNNPLYKDLSEESKQVLKLAALTHDFGKKGNVITQGHAVLSRMELEKFIDKYNLPLKIKERVLNQVEHHHWFEGYNKGTLSKDDVKKLFKTSEDIKVAKILAKADFESVNPSFHLGRMNSSKYLTQSEFDKEFEAKISAIN